MKPDRGAAVRPAVLFGVAAGVTLLALVLRLLAAPAFTIDGTDCDGAGYWDVARSLASGHGWQSHSHRFLYLPPPDLPQPDVHWSPLYPLLMAGSFRLLGESMAAARLPMLLCGALLAGAMALLAGRLTGDRRAALLAGLFGALHPTLVVWSLRLETEVGTMFLSTLVLWSAARQESWRDALLAGLLLGFAWLMKYQSGLLVVALAAGAFLAERRGPALRRLLVSGAVALLVVLPWLVRNARLFGDPFFTAVAPMILSGYREFGSERAFITRTSPPPATLPYLLGHLPEVFGRALFGARYLWSGLLREHAGSLLVLPLSVLGVVALFRKGAPRVLPALLWAAVLTAACAVAIHQVRYLLALLPLLLVIASAAVTAWPRRFATGALLVLGVVAAADMARQARAGVTARGEGWTPGAMSCALEARTAAAWVRGATAPGEALFVTEVYHYALLTGRNAVNIPPQDDDVRALGRRYAIRRLLIAEEDLPVRLPGWVGGAPAWAHLDTTLAPPAGHGTSPIRVYRLDP